MFCFFLIHLTVLAQYKHSASMFYGYSHYFSNSSHILYPYNYTLGVNYGYYFNDKVKLESGLSFCTRNSVYYQIGSNAFEGLFRHEEQTYL